jgi:hypothetical protein
MYLALTMDLMDSQDDPGKMEMMKIEMTKKTLQTGLISFMESFIRLTSLTFAPRQPPIPFFFLSPISQHSPRQQISLRRTLLHSTPPTLTQMTTPSPLSQYKQKLTTLTSSRSSSGYKILDDQMASLMQNMLPSCSIVWISS